MFWHFSVFHGFFWLYFPHFESLIVKKVPGIYGNLVVKSKLHPRSGSSLEAVEPHP